jgi:predicted AlkP superfamily phosphohydrolase/phosphomutase
MSPPVAAIGLDSAEWKVIEALLERGALPNMARLARRGITAPLENDSLYRTSLVWEAFLTGSVDPTRRFRGAIEFDPETYVSYRIGARPLRAFFDQLDGIRTVAFDVPYLSLAGRDQDVCVNSWGGHIRTYPRASNPSGLLREIDARFGPHPAWAIEHVHNWRRPEKLAEVAQALADGARLRGEIASWLVSNHPDWDLLLTVLTESHSAAEWYGHSLAVGPPLTGIPTAAAARGHLHDIYRALDEGVGQIVDALPENASVVVFSLHGADARNVDVPSTVLLPELLHRLDRGCSLLRDPDQARWRRDGFPPILLEPDEEWYDYMRRRRVGSTRVRLDRWRWRLRPSRNGDVPEETARTPDEIGTPRDPLDYQVVSWYRRAWPRMRAFALPTFADGRVRINLAGRESAGIVAGRDYERACDDVERALRACRDPRTGRGVIASIERPCVSDPYRADGLDADLVIEWVDGIDALEHPEEGTIGPFPFQRMGAHTSRGFALIASPGVEPARLPERDVADLPPTLVALLGCEADVQGKSLLPN